jgi:uncharacterized protein YyaL (SSP411 family)
MSQRARFKIQGLNQGLAITTCIICWVSLGTVPSYGQEVQWLRSAEQASALATQTGKPILVYVRSASCHYCDLMQTNVWQNPGAAAVVMRDFIPLKLTREENPEAIEVLKIKGYPATIIFSPDRQYVERVDGYVEVEKFLSVVNKIRLASHPSSAPSTLR